MSVLCRYRRYLMMYSIYIHVHIIIHMYIYIYYIYIYTFLWSSWKIECWGFLNTILICSGVFFISSIHSTFVPPRLPGDVFHARPCPAPSTPSAASPAEKESLESATAGGALGLLIDL